MPTAIPDTADPDVESDVESDVEVDQIALDRLHTLATTVLNAHTNDDGWCAACPSGVAFPCRSAVVAEHNAALL